MLQAEDVARYFLANQGAETGEPISNQKIQKLCYYAQGFALARLGRPLFFEDIEHWQNGPVVPSLWRNYRTFGSSPIPIPHEPLPLNLYDAEISALLDGINRYYGKFSAWQLRNKTHNEPPWVNTPDRSPITHLALRGYFESLGDLDMPPEDAIEESSDRTNLGARMFGDQPFRKFTERGLSEISGGRYSALDDVKRRLNDV